MLQGLYFRPVRIRDWALKPEDERVLSCNSALMPVASSLVFSTSSLLLKQTETRRSELIGESLEIDPCDLTPHQLS